MNNLNNNFNNSPLFEALEYKDMEGMIKPTVHVDEFAAKMGDDDDIVVVSFFVRADAAAKDLVNWFEKGYEFVLDSEKSPGEISPGRWLVYVEMRRRTQAGANVAQLIDDLATLTEFEPKDWEMTYKGKTMPFTQEAFDSAVPLSPKEYRERTEKGLNEMRISAGLAPRQIYQPTKDLKQLQAAAGI
jgi:hypothetical protein